MFCILTKRTDKAVDGKTMSLTYAGFSGKDMKVYMTETGITAYRPSGKKMKCTVQDSSLNCVTP